MAEQTNIFRINLDNEFYLALDTTDPNAALALAKIKKVELKEAFGLAIPTMTIDFIDGVGITLQTHINPDHTYTITYGTGPLDITYSKFKYANNNILSHGGGRAELLANRTLFFNEKWFEFLSIEHTRSWEDTYSSVLKDIVKDIVEFHDIEDTTDRQIIIQPKMNNFEFIKWITPQIGIDWRFVYRFDGKFVAKPFSSYASGKLYRTYVLSEDSFYDEERNIQDCKNIQIKTPYMSNGDNGAFGITAHWFDFDSREFKTKSVGYEKDYNPLSDWAYISKKHTQNPRMVSMGRNTNSANEIQSNIMKSANNEVKVTIQINGDLNIHTGDLVELVIPSINNEGVLINQIYSGKYVVSGVIHQLGMLDVRTFITTLELTRAGINNRDERGLV